VNTSAQIWTLVVLGLVWAICDILERRQKIKTTIFPRSKEMFIPGTKIFYCPICGFDCKVGGYCPNPGHDLAEMLEQKLENKTQEPGTTDAIRRILKPEERGEK
jgi:hypothetical protein